MSEPSPSPNSVRSIDIAAELDRYRKRLLDLSANNRLLSYRKSRSRTVQIVDELPNQIYSHLVTDGRSFQFEADPAASTTNLNSSSIELPSQPSSTVLIENRHQDDRLQTDLDEDRLERILKTMMRDARSAIEETGINHLYLAIGFLQWWEARDSDRAHNAPLILIPVKIEKSSDRRRHRYLYRAAYTGEDLQSNVSLIEKLRIDFGLAIPEFEDEQSPEEYFDAVAGVILEENRWSIRREAVLGFFSFSKIYLYNDLDPTRWPKDALSSNRLIRTVFEGSQSDESDFGFSSDYNIDEEIEASETPLVVDADSSQHSALIDVIREQDVVIEGPPGTGKSQTITNILALAISNGWNVLFLSEKLAALEVVKRNLDRVGLADFCLPLHSEMGKPREVYESLKQRLNRKQKSPSGHASAIRELNSYREKLLSYCESIRQPLGPNADPAHDVFWRVSRLRQLLGDKAHRQLSVNIQLDSDALSDRLRLFDQLQGQFREIGGVSEHPWRGFDCAKYYAAKQSLVESALETLSDSARSFERVAQRLRTSSSCDTFWSMRNLVAAAPLNEMALQIPVDGISNSLCKGLATSNSMAIAEKLESEIIELNNLKRRVETYWRCDRDRRTSLARELLDAASGFPPLELGILLSDAVAFRGQLAAVRTGLAELVKLIENLGRLNLPNMTIAECFESMDLIRMLSDPVVEKGAVLHDSLFYESAIAVARQAKSQWTEIATQRTAIDEVLILRDAPDAEELQSIRSAILAHHRSRWRFLRREYRNAKRRVLGFLRPSTPWKPAAIAEHLEELETLNERIRDFNLDSDFKSRLNDLFDGYETDWDRLGRILGWIQTVKEKGFTLADVRGHFGGLEALESLSWVDALRRSLESVTAELEQSAPLDLLGINKSRIRHQPIHDILANVSDLEQRLETINVALAQIAAPESISICMNQCRETLELEDRHNSILANNAYQELCGRDFHGANTDLELFQRTIAWFKALDTLHMPPKLIEWMCSDDIGERASLLRRMLSEAREPSEAWASALDDLQSLGPINDTWLYEENGFGSLSNRVSSLQTTLPELSNWAEYCRTVNQARLCGLSEFVELYEANTFSPNESRLLFELLFWEEIANQFVAANPSLSGFSRRTHEQIRSTFADLDHRVLNLNQQLVAAQALSRKPPIGNGTGRVSAYTELSLIRHETEKSRRHCRLRTLMKRAGRATQCLKPCFMMSPLAVAQFLPPGAVQFDLVVMDEASQVKPEDALGALARARRVVIVGDPKQLPPTTFFERLDRDEIDESDELVLDESESILEVAAKAFPRLRRLKWHYRSLHHSLIEFSNRRFYDGDLLIFPSVSSQSGKLGVRFHFVEDGLVKSGKNEKEAEVLASAIIEHALNHPDDSLGVGTFNMKQRDLILDLLERRCEEDAQFQRAVSRISDGINGLFIKNLENLQGDERDVIFISYTYGKDPKSGKLMQRFGPITLETGWRRLNVLVTRARKRVEVFSSIRPSEILADGKSRGVVAMKDYLSYAESGDIPERVIIEERAPESPFEEAVAGAIADMGFRVIPQVGVAGYRIDLGVLRPGSEDEFILGIECDGATYHSAKSVRDRDRLREEVIISRGWNIHRVWSTDWFLNQPAEEERLRQVINALLGSQNDASR